MVVYESGPTMFLSTKFKVYAILSAKASLSKIFLHQPESYFVFQIHSPAS